MIPSSGKMVMADSLGEFLRRERELRHVTLDDIAERTKISRRYLEAIEEDRYDRLPGEAFVRGFIRSYAQFVGLDPEDALLIYNQSRTVHDAAPTHPAATPLARQAWHERSLLWLLVAGVIIVGGVLVSAMGLLNRPNSLRWSSSPHLEVGSMPADEAPLVLTVLADSDTWLQITIDNQDSQDMVLRAGQSTKWLGREHFVLSIGNARATRLQLNGRDVTTPQPTPSILRQYTISRAMLP
jgi:cytoskeleton protein RodZ